MLIYAGKYTLNILGKYVEIELYMFANRSSGYVGLSFIF